MRYWVGSFASVGATQLQVMGLGWLTYELSESALVLGYLGAATALPAIIITLFGGALADRFDKRILLMITSLLVATLLGTLSVLDYTGTVEVWHVLTIAGLISLVNGVDWPARQAIFPALIEREDMMSAVALTTVIWQATRMAMPAFGGLVIAYSDTWVVFAFCTAGFLAMYFVMLSLKMAPAERVAAQSTLTQIAEGIRFILQDRLFLILLLLSYAIFFFASSHMQLMPAFSALLGVGEEGYGFLLSMTGIGSVVGTLVCSYLTDSRHLGLLMLASALVSCLFLYGFAGSSEFGVFSLALTTLFFAHLCFSIFMITSTTVLQLEVPDELRGRVMGFHAICYNMMPLGGLFAGALANVIGAPVAIAISVSIFLVLLLWITISEAQIRRIDGRALTASHG